MSCLTSLQEITKFPTEILAVAMEFSEILGTSTISTESVSITPSGITVSSDMIDGTQVQFLIADGVAGVNYKVTVTITTSDGETLVGIGSLKVRDS
jgi:hypothetical protein